MPDDSFLLQQLLAWLRKTRLPGDQAKLGKTLRVLRMLNVQLEPEDRAEIRQLISATFGVDAAAALGYLPEERPPELLTRSQMPKLPQLLEDYVTATAKQESPSSFHAFALLTCMGAALGRRVWLDMVWFKVWPNMSVVLTGPAGGPRKNMAWDMALDAVRNSFRGWQAKQISDASPQALVNALKNPKGDSVGFIYAPEFRQFFPSAQYMEGAIPLITRLLDNPDHYPVERIMREGGALRNVTLSMGGGSTLDWLAKLPEDAQGGGFFTRVMIVHEESSRPAVSAPGRSAAVAAAIVKNKLSDVDHFAWGPIVLSPDGRKWFDSWYKELKERKVTTPRLILYYNRKQTHLLRTALLTSLPRRSINAEALEAAERLLTWVEEPLPDVYRIIGMSRSGEKTRSVLDMLRALGGQVEFEKLAREMKGTLDAKDLQMAIATLKQAGQIVEQRTAAEHVVTVREVGFVE